MPDNLEIVIKKATTQEQADAKRLLKTVSY
jgi:hypothetical protein